MKKSKKYNIIITSRLSKEVLEKIDETNCKVFIPCGFDTINEVAEYIEKYAHCLHYKNILKYKDAMFLVYFTDSEVKNVSTSVWGRSPDENIDYVEDIMRNVMAGNKIYINLIKNSTYYKQAFMKYCDANKIKYTIEPGEDDSGIDELINKIYKAK